MKHKLSKADVKYLVCLGFNLDSEGLQHLCSPLLNRLSHCNGTRVRLPLGCTAPPANSLRQPEPCVTHRLVFEELRKAVRHTVTSPPDKKRLCLFKRILAESGHQDQQLVADISSGFSLTGRLPRSEVFKDCYRPASQTVDMLREGASRARAATLAMCVPSDDPRSMKG